MKKMTLVAIIMMAAMNVMNAQSPPNWEEQVVDMVVYGSGEASVKPAEDTIHITGLICDEFNNGKYEGYLPIVLEYPVIQEFFDRVSHKTIGYSKYLRVNDACQISALTAGPRTKDYSGIIVHDAYTRPAQMRPFIDTLFIEEGKKEILKPWHWVPYEETFIQTGNWHENGNLIEGMSGMKRIDVYGPVAGDTVIYDVAVIDGRLGASSAILNTFVVVGTEKSHYGVDEAVASQINIYPNPSNDGIVTIKGNGIVEIFNILGQKVMGDMEVVKETRVFLESGLYIVRINGELSSKVIIR